MHDVTAAMMQTDELLSFRERFHIPRRNGSEVTYLCGNSLGLQPRTAEDAVRIELEEWRTHAVEGHFSARNPWFSYHRMFQEPLAAIVGARPHEVVAMNTLTVNLHLMMTTFYRPAGRRTKILIVGNEFPSDRYAVESQIRLHGLDPHTDMVEVQPSDGALISMADVTRTIDTHADTVALVLFSGVHYFTGQFFDVQAITAAAHAVGAIAGFDLAHAAGNVELSMHDWGADFAVWCSYKYLNSGPGGVGGAFVHERWADRADLPRLAGWWGNQESTRFSMEHGFIPTYGVDGWQLSNAQIFPLAIHKASLDIFTEATMARISAKRNALTTALYDATTAALATTDVASIITPADPAHRGAQLSIRFTRNGQDIFKALLAEGVVADWRTPDVMRVAPAPLYCTFDDVARFTDTFSHILSRHS